MMRCMKCKRDNDGRKQDYPTLQSIRQQAAVSADRQVALVSKGKTAREVAEIFGVNVRSVFRWLSDSAEGGQQALLAKPIPGRPRLWTGADMRWLAETRKERTPQQWRWAFALWTLPWIQEVIRREWGKSLSLSTVKRIRWSLGLTPQRPLHRAYPQGSSGGRALASAGRSGDRTGSQGAGCGD
jgi:transposase